MAESSNKSLVRIIKKLLADNKRNWDTQLVYALWADMVSNKRSINFSPFQIVYGVEVVIPIQLALPVMKFIQDKIDEPNSVQRRMLQLIKNHQIREVLMDKAQKYKERVNIYLIKRKISKCFLKMI